MIHTAQEPYDSIVKLLVELQFRAAKGDLTGQFDVANALTGLLEQARIDGAKAFVTFDAGKRCKIKDRQDFPELKDHERCYTCLMWEHFDEWLKEENKE